MQAKKAAHYFFWQNNELQGESALTNTGFNSTFSTPEEYAESVEHLIESRPEGVGITILWDV